MVELISIDFVKIHKGPIEKNPTMIVVKKKHTKRVRKKGNIVLASCHERFDPIGHGAQKIARAFTYTKSPEGKRRIEDLIKSRWPTITLGLSNRITPNPLKKKTEKKCGNQKMLSLPVMVKKSKTMRKTVGDMLRPI